MPEPTDDQAELFTVEELAALLRTTPEGVRNRVRRGSIPADCVCDVVRPMLFRSARVREWLALNPDGGES